MVFVAAESWGHLNEFLLSMADAFFSVSYKKCPVQWPPHFGMLNRVSVLHSAMFHDLCTAVLVKLKGQGVGELPQKGHVLMVGKK